VAVVGELIAAGVPQLAQPTRAALLVALHYTSVLNSPRRRRPRVPMPRLFKNATARHPTCCGARSCNASSRDIRRIWVTDNRSVARQDREQPS
jgi:hypothetical protein